MRILGKREVIEFCKRHNQAKGYLDAWVSEVELATWKIPQDIKNRYSSVSFLSNNRVVFNIRGNSYRLVIQVKYVNGIIKIEHIGTHAEYDKWRLK